MFDFFTKEHTPYPLRYLIAYKNLLRSIENIGIAVVYGIRLEQRFIKNIKFDSPNPQILCTGQHLARPVYPGEF